MVLNDRINYIIKNYDFKKDNGLWISKINDIYFVIDLSQAIWYEKNNVLKIGNKNIQNLLNKENYSVLIFILEILKSKYSISKIELEKKWQLGREASGRLDIIIYDLSNKPFWMIEVKDESEFQKYTSSSANINKIKQLISYYNQERDTKFLSYFSFNFSSNQPLFATIKVTDRMKNSPNLEDIYDIWDKNFDSTNFFKINPYNLSKKYLKNNDLILIDNDNIVHNIFNQFLTILRINTVSDKSNSFDKLINLFIAKIYDELQDDINFEINSNNTFYNIEGKRFQYLSEIDTPESFLIRLYDLYKNGMKYCLNKEIIDYTDDDFWELANKNNNRKLLKMFQDLRLKKDNTFAFIEVFDDWTFKNNFEIVKELVELLQKYKFKYNNKKQFLGDFFEELLNHSWKQEAGQFFTPLPIVEMMTNALPIKENIQNKLLSTKIENELLPKILDYACGSGHFLISSMDIIQKYIDNIDLNSIKINNYKNKIQSYKNDKYFWAKEYVYGIEKDYRLSKTTKIASFLNGDGEANVLNADALLKFDSEIFNGTIFYSKKSNNEIFDYIISNPPYSVKGFMKNFIISGIKPKDGTFEFLNEINYKNTNIESFFLERTYQLLKNNGFASIVLPQSFLTNDKYSEIRSWMLENFILKSIFLSGPNTFSGTTTSPVILFLQKSNKKIINLNYKVFVIHSPIMIDHNSLKLEKDFLGFFFSSNKNKKGITITNFHNLKDSYSENIKNMLLDKEIRNDKYSKVSLLNDLIIEDHKNKKAIFTRRNLPKKLIDYFILSDVCEERKIIESNENININQLNYIEISNINNNKLIGNFKKNMKSSNFCHKGDLLISSVAPKSGKVWISDGTYKVSSAIIVLKFNVESVRDYIFNYLKNNVDNIFANINSLSEGFKVTYSKISSWNLLNNIYFKKV